MTTSRYTLVALGILAATGCAARTESSGAGAVEGAGGSDVAVELSRTEPAYWVLTRDDGHAYFASRVGSDVTTCPDGIERPACSVADLDLERLDLDADDASVARAQLVDGTAVARAKLIAGGKLVVSDVWTREAAAPTLAGGRTPTDQMFRLRDVHEGCDVACSTCDWLRAEPLDGGRATQASALDLSLVGGALADDAQGALGRGELLARGAKVGDAFVVVGVFVPFASSAPAPSSAPPPAPGQAPPLR